MVNAMRRANFVNYAITPRVKCTVVLRLTIKW